MLGPDHPLTRAESQERVLRAQFLVTVVFGAAAALLSPLLGPAALRLSFGAAAVAAALALASFAAHMRLRGRAFELIASGREDLPLQVVECERSRLRDRRYRRKLASTIDVITLQTDSRAWFSPIYADHASVIEARTELTQPLDAAGSLVGEELDVARPADAATGSQRVRDVQSRIVAFADRCGDAALGGVAVRRRVGRLREDCDRGAVAGCSESG